MMKRVTAIVFILVTCSTWGNIASAQIEGPLDTLLWNDIRAVTVVDDYAIGITNDAVVVCRFDSSSRLFHVQRVVPVIFEPESISVFDDSVLIIRTRDNKLASYSLSTLPDLPYRWTLDPGIPFADYAIYGKSLFFSSWFHGVWQFRMGEQGDIRFIDSSMVGILVTQMAVDNQYLYVLDTYNGIMRYDLSQNDLKHFVDYLYVPVEIESFVRDDERFILRPRSRKEIYFGTFDVFGPRIIDSLTDIGYIQHIFLTPQNYILFEPRALHIVSRDDAHQQTTIPSMGNSSRGDIFYIKAHPYLLLPRFSGGMTMYDLDVPGIVRSGLYRSGPISALTFIDSHLFTSGGENPVDIFSFDDELIPSRDFTMFEGEHNIQTLINNGDTLIAYFASLNKVAFIARSLEPDSFHVERSFFLEDTLAGEMLYLTEKIDTLRALLTVGETSIQAYTISDSMFVTPVSPWRFHGRIRSVVVQDSLLITATSKNQIWVKRIHPDFSSEVLSIRDVENTVRKLCVHEQVLYAFINDKILMYDISDPVTFRFLRVVKIPLMVTDAKIIGDTLFAISSDQIGMFLLKDDFPQVIALQQGGGTMMAISEQRGIIAVSDGRMIHTFHYKTENTNGTPEPDLTGIYAISQNYPNPFNSGTTVQFSLQQQQHVRVTIYNLLGQQVRTLLDEIRPAGEYEVYWDGTNNAGYAVASGVYFYRFDIGNARETRKMVLLK